MINSYTQATMHLPFIQQLARYKLLATTNLINKEVFHVSFEWWVKDSMVFSEIVQWLATRGFSATQNLRETVH